MKDGFGREIDYLRISITDKCNLRCRYCMPEGVEIVPMPNLLTFEEIVQVCTAAAQMGIRNIKITGGEPLVRRGAPSLLGMLRQIPGIEDVTLTTNGVLLKKYLPELTAHGLHSVNISLDTLDKDLYYKITGKDVFSQVMDGISAAVKAGLQVKINTVLLRDYNEDCWKEMIEFIRRHPIDLRFIEIMPIGEGKSFTGISNEELFGQIKKDYPDIVKNTSVHGNGPATYYSIPGFQGDIGFISAMHGKFCEQCNRIRMSAQGEIKPCLCFGNTVDLREVLRSEKISDKDKALRRALEEAVAKKPQAHCFEQIEEITEGKRMFSIGG